MSSTFSISIRDNETSTLIPIETDSYAVLYLEQGHVKVSGRIELSDLAPMLLKIGLEKLMKTK